MREVRTPRGVIIKCSCDCGRCMNADGVINHCSACLIGLWRDSVVKYDEYANSAQMWALIRDRTVYRPRRFAVMLSRSGPHSDMNFSNRRFEHRLDAHTHARSLILHTNLKYEVMEDINGEWKSVRGETCDEVQQRWQS